MGYVFISYSSKNQASADAMRNLLNRRGIRTWMAPGDIPPGSTYAKNINQAVRECACFLLMLSEDAQNSVWVPKEVERAVNYRKVIIPVQIDDAVLNDEFELYISSNQVVAVRKIDENLPEMKHILASIAACCSAADDAPLDPGRQEQEQGDDINSSGEMPSEQPAVRSAAFEGLPNCDTEQPYIFVCYDTRDRKRVFEDCRKLRQNGYNLWIDEANIDKTDFSWRDSSLDAIRSFCCERVIFYVSDFSLTNPRCLEELRETWSRETTDVHFGDVPFICVDVKQMGDIMEEVQRIVREIRADAGLTVRQKSEKVTTLSVFLREVFNSNDMRVRIHPADEPGRKSDYYADIMMSLPEQTRVFGQEAVK